MVATVKCPTCKSEVVWGEISPQRPFCSLRCKGIDLGTWADDSYVVQGAEPSSAEDLAALEAAIEAGLRDGSLKTD